MKAAVVVSALALLACAALAVDAQKYPYVCARLRPRTPPLSGQSRLKECAGGAPPPPRRRLRRRLTRTGPARALRERRIAASERDD